MSKYLFENFKQWRVCFMAGVQKMAWGFFRIITCIILGFISVLVWLWREFVVMVRNNPKFFIIAFTILAILIWLFTFVSMRARAVGAEHQRDSISYELSKFTQMYDETDSTFTYNTHWDNGED